MRSIRSLLLITLLIGALFGVTYIIYNLKTEQTFLDQQLSALKTAFADKMQTTEKVISQETLMHRWDQVQPRIRDTVVQIFVHTAHFNWLEPYKSPIQNQMFGSGFFISPDGLILTNAHVIDEARSITIQIPSMGKRRFETDIIGVSPERDLALLQLKPEELALLIDVLGKIPYLALGDSDTLHRAEEIMAVGYPLGQQSLKSTTGVVSGREHIDGHHMIQISAPINPGSSGGPSLTIQGEVIGINTAIIGGAQNVGYIIPSNEVKLFLKQLEQLPNSTSIKLLRKPFLGVIFNPATPTLTEYLGNPQPGGLYVVETYKGSPLHKAGILPGDMIYQINGIDIDLFGEMKSWSDEEKMSIIDYVSRLMLGQKIKLVFYRKGIRKEVTFDFAQSDPLPIRAVFPAYEKIDYEIIGGIVFMQLTLNHLPHLIKVAPDLARFMEFKHQLAPRILVSQIFADSAIMRSRTFGPGSLIEEINGEKVRTLDDVRTALKKSLSTNYLTILTTENVFTVLPFERVIKDEPRLSSIYLYTITPSTQGLMKEYFEKHPVKDVSPAK